MSRRVVAVVSGHVQGVGYRWFVRELASGPGWRARRATCPTAGSRWSWRDPRTPSPRCSPTWTGPAPRAGDAGRSPDEPVQGSSGSRQRDERDTPPTRGVGILRVDLRVQACHPGDTTARADRPPGRRAHPLARKGRCSHGQGPVRSRRRTRGLRVAEENAVLRAKVRRLEQELERPARPAGRRHRPRAALPGRRQRRAGAGLTARTFRHTRTTDPDIPGLRRSPR